MALLIRCAAKSAETLRALICGDSLGERRGKREPREDRVPLGGCLEILQRQCQDGCV